MHALYTLFHKNEKLELYLYLRITEISMHFYCFIKKIGKKYNFFKEKEKQEVMYKRLILMKVRDKLY